MTWVNIGEKRLELCTEHRWNRYWEAAGPVPVVEKLDWFHLWHRTQNTKKNKKNNPVIKQMSIFVFACQMSPLEYMSELQLYCTVDEKK